MCEFRLAGLYQRQETWRNAEAQGRLAALNLLGRQLAFETIPVSGPINTRGVCTPSG